MNANLNNLLTYISFDPKSVNKLAYKYGYMPASTQEGRLGFLLRGVQEEGDRFFKDIARFHPDRELILNADGSINDGAGVEPNVIDISGGNQATTQTISDTKKTDHSFNLRIVAILIIAFVLYKILSK